MNKSYNVDAFENIKKTHTQTAITTTAIQIFGIEPTTRNAAVSLTTTSRRLLACYQVFFK